MKMPRIKVALLGALLALMPCWAAPGLAANHIAPVEFGVFPYLSTRALLELYEPVRAHVQAELKRPANLYSAPGFKNYVDRIQAGQFDLALTPPHLARLVQREAGYIPLAMVTRELRGVIVVAKAAPMQTLRDLKGRHIATPNKIALVTILGVQLLRDHGLGSQDSVLLKDVSTHSNAVLAVQRGEVEAAITENSALQQMPEDLRNSVRIIAQTQRMPHVVFLAHPRFGPAGLEQLKKVLLQFPHTAEGQAFMKSSGFEGLRPVEETDLKSVDPILKELKRLLDTMPP